MQKACQLQLGNELKEKLLRGNSMDGFPSFSMYMLGCDFVCTDVVIDQLCKKAKCKAIASLKEYSFPATRVA